MNRRIPEIDGARCLCNYLIVLHHSFVVGQFCALSIIEYEIWKAVHIVTHSTLAALFFISGYCMARGYSECRYIEKLRRRVMRLGIPYLAWNLIFISVYYVLAMKMPLLQSRLDTWGLNSINGFLGHLLNPILRPADGPLWFIRTLLIYAVFFPLMWRVLKIRKGVLLFAIAGVWSFCSMLFGWERLLLYSFPVYSILAFLFGVWCSSEGVSLAKLTNRSVIVVCGVILLVRYSFGLSCAVSGSWIWNLAAVAGIPLWLMLGRGLSSQFNENPVYGHLKGIAYFVYASHVLVCPFISHGVGKLFKVDFYGKFSLLVLAYVVGGVLICWCMKQLLDRLTPRIAKLLNGEL